MERKWDVSVEKNECWVGNLWETQKCSINTWNLSYIIHYDLTRSIMSRNNIFIHFTLTTQTNSG